MVEMRTVDGTTRKVVDGDFVTLVSGLETSQTLISGLYIEDSGKPYVCFFKQGKLTKRSVTEQDLSTGIILGYKEKSFELMDNIANALKDMDTKSVEAENNVETEVPSVSTVRKCCAGEVYQRNHRR